MKRTNFPKRSEGDGVDLYEVIKLDGSSKEGKTEKEGGRIEFKTQKELADFAHQKAEEISPEVNRYQHSGDKKYLYFPVIEQYFEREPIIDSILIKKLKEGGRLLSVGVGPAKLEHLLFKGFDLPRDAITLADIEFLPEVRTSDLNRAVFDMREDWPKFTEKFDYILFPESFGVAQFLSKKDFTSKSVQRFFEDMREMWNLVYSGDAPEVSDRRWDFAKLIIEMDLPWMIKKYHTIFCAVNALKKEGELRFSGHLMSNDELTYVVMKLKEDFEKEVEVTFEPYLKIKLHNPREASSA